MKIFVGAHYFDGPPQGTTSYLYGIYKSMIEQQLPVEIVFGVGSEKIYELYPDLRGVTRIAKYKYSSALGRLLIDIPRILREERFDFAHFQYLLPIKLWGESLPKSVVSMHDVLFMENRADYPLGHRLLRKFLFKSAAKKADVLTTISDYSVSSISKYFGIDKTKVLLAHCAAPKLELFDKMESRKFVFDFFGVDKYLLYVSRFEPRKNHVSLLQAFFELDLDKKGYELVFVGDKSILVDAFNSFWEALPLSRRSSIKIFTDVSAEGLKNLYNAAQLFVYPSLSEGFGMPPLEAAILNTPTVCSNATSISDFNFFGDNLANCSDVSALKECISRNLSHPLCAEKLSEIRNEILRRYSWDDSALRLFNAMSAKQNITEIS
jgi:glycosyltransferase involved in cell wall biosynthesis